MQPPEDIKPEDVNDWIKEQVPWLKNPENLIPTVNPDDLKSLWKLQNDLITEHGQPGKTVVVSGEVAKRALSRGANFGDVYYRLSWLFWLQKFSEAGHLEFPWIHEGNIDDAVYKALASIQMTGMRPREDKVFPFDVDELIRLIKEEPEA